MSSQLHKVEFDSNGFATGIYAPEDPNIPADAQEISDALLKTLSSDTGKYIVVSDGNKITNVKAYIPSLDEQKNLKIVELTNNCKDAITGGYTSNALGSAFTYPSQPTDQANMVASVTDSLLPNLASNWTTKFWCADSNGTWAFRAHTAGEIQQAGQDGKAFVQAQQEKLESLTQQVNAATTKKAVAAITWS